MARSELNSLLDFAGKRVEDDSDTDTSDQPLHGFSERELQEELERRRQARQEVEEAIHGRRSPEPAPQAGTGRASSARPGGAGTGGTRTGGAASAGAGSGGAPESLRIQKAYAALEVPPGSNFETVRKAYRNLMRKYHPDHHTESPAKQRAANEVAQRLTEAYKLLEKRLR